MHVVQAKHILIKNVYLSLKNKTKKVYLMNTGSWRHGSYLQICQTYPPSFVWTGAYMVHSLYIKYFDVSEAKLASPLPSVVTATP